MINQRFYYNGSLFFPFPFSFWKYLDMFFIYCILHPFYNFILRKMTIYSKVLGRVSLFWFLLPHPPLTLTSDSSRIINYSHLIYSDSRVDSSFNSIHIIVNKLNYLNIDYKKGISTRLNIFKHLSSSVIFKCRNYY